MTAIWHRDRRAGNPARPPRRHRGDPTV